MDGWDKIEHEQDGFARRREIEETEEKGAKIPIKYSNT